MNKRPVYAVLLLACSFLVGIGVVLLVMAFLMAWDSAGIAELTHEKVVLNQRGFVAGFSGMIAVIVGGFGAMCSWAGLDNS